MSNPRHRELRERALKGGTRYLPKLREQHKLTARERLDLLLDKGSFIEDGLYANVLAVKQRHELERERRRKSRCHRNQRVETADDAFLRSAMSTHEPI